MRKFLLIFFIFIAAGLFFVRFLGYQESWEGSPQIRVYISSQRATAVMKVEEYLVGVVAAEMPAGFCEEALKAQVIAARTYALKKANNYSREAMGEHPQAHICSKPEHCQGWLSDGEMRKKWGWLRYQEYRRKIQLAVKETFGQVITYQGKLIDPVYHSTCGGVTENAGEVWQYQLPYLKSASCTWDKNSPKYRSNVMISFSELEEKLGQPCQAVPVSGLGNQSILQVREKTSTGRIKSLILGNQLWNATEFRRRLGLNSTSFSWHITEQGIEFTTTGYGHGVGMCQYGANGLAQEGKTAKQILTHYYSGVKIQKIY